jgi:hypothetical protein
MPDALLCAGEQQDCESAADAFTLLRIGQRSNAMTPNQRDREIEALELDEQNVGVLVAEIDTHRLHLLADAIRLELSERYQGKPLEKSRYH